MGERYIEKYLTGFEIERNGNDFNVFKNYSYVGDPRGLLIMAMVEGEGLENLLDDEKSSVNAGKLYE